MKRDILFEELREECQSVLSFRADTDTGDYEGHELRCGH